MVCHFIQTSPIDERTVRVAETLLKHPGQIRNPSNRTFMVSVVTCRHESDEGEGLCYSRIY